MWTVLPVCGIPDFFLFIFLQWRTPCILSLAHSEITLVISNNLWLETGPGSRVPVLEFLGEGSTFRLKAVDKGLVIPLCLLQTSQFLRRRT